MISRFAGPTRVTEHRHERSNDPSIRSCPLAAAQIDLVRARRARRDILQAALRAPDAAARLSTRLAIMDRYERRALSRRKRDPGLRRCTPIERPRRRRHFGRTKPTGESSMSPACWRSGPLRRCAPNSPKLALKRRGPASRGISQDRNRRHLRALRCGERASRCREPQGRGLSAAAAVIAHRRHLRDEEPRQEGGRVCAAGSMFSSTRL
jgi:hypothetical protein